MDIPARSAPASRRQRPLHVHQVVLALVDGVTAEPGHVVRARALGTGEVVDERAGPGRLLKAVEDHGTKASRHPQLVEDQRDGLTRVVAQLHSLVPVHPGETGVVFHQGHDGSVPLNQQDVPHMARVLQSRPDCRRRPPLGRPRVGGTQGLSIAEAHVA